jgi:predicted phage gp36 major capsid-like protein
MAAPDPQNDSDTLISVLGEVLDLLAGLEARQQVLAQSIAEIQSALTERSTFEISDELAEQFARKLEEERNGILSRVSLSSLADDASGDTVAGDEAIAGDDAAGGESAGGEEA